MTRIELLRTVAADPASVALLLAGPAARELWPPGEPDVAVAPPVRTGMGFAADLAVGPAGAGGRGRMLVQRADGGAQIRLLVTTTEDGAAALRRRLGRYLHELATVAVDRSDAA